MTDPYGPQPRRDQDVSSRGVCLLAHRERKAGDLPVVPAQLQLVGGVVLGQGGGPGEEGGGNGGRAAG